VPVPEAEDQAEVDNDPGVVETQDAADNPDQGQPIIPIMDLDPNNQANPTPGAPAPGGVPGAAAPAGAAPAGPRMPFATPWQPSGPSFPQPASYPVWR
jgi:hypothetical protein